MALLFPKVRARGARGVTTAAIASEFDPSRLFAALVDQARGSIGSERRMKAEEIQDRRKAAGRVQAA